MQLSLKSYQVEMMLAMYFNWILFLSSLITVNVALEVCDYRVPHCVGNELDCYRSLPCYNGVCGDSGNCICSGCWAGSQCDKYVDKYQPEFMVDNKFVTLYPEDTGVLFTVNANDEDLSSTCHNEIDCPCGHTFYFIREAPNGHPFRLNKYTGEVEIINGGFLRPNDIFTLTISVQTNESDSGVTNNGNTLEVIINVIEKPKIEDANFDGEEINSIDDHRLSKRDTGSASNTTIQITQLNPTTPKVIVQPGDRIDFQINITIATGTFTEIQVEIFSLDPITNETAFALVDVAITNVGSALTTAFTTDTKPTLTACTVYPEIYNQAVFDLGNVSAGSGNNVISIAFSAIFLNITPYVVDGSNYSVLAGVSYDSDAYVWIAQVEFQADFPEDQIYPSYMFVDGPETIAIDGFAMFAAHFYSVSPNESYQVDVFGFSAPLDSYSTGGIVLTSVGSNFPFVRDDFFSYPYQQLPSASENTSARTTWTINSLINTDNSRTVANLTVNELTLNFFVSAADNEELIGSVMSIACTMMIGGKTIWTNLINLTVTDRQTTDMALPTTMTVRNSTVLIAAGGTAQALIDIVIPDGKYCQLLLEIMSQSPPDPSSPIVTICDYSSTSGANIPYIIPVTPAFNDSKMSVDLGRIWNTNLIPSNGTASTITVAVMVRAENSAADGQQLTVTLGSLPVKYFTLQINGDGNLIESELSAVSVSMWDILNLTTVAVGAESAALVTLTFPTDIFMTNLMLEMASSLINETTKGRICQAQVLSVGDIPCLNKRVINSNVKYNQTEKNVIDSASMNLGGICISKENNSVNEVVIRVSFKVQSPAVDTNNPFHLYVGMSSGSASQVWVSSAVYRFATSNDEIFSIGYTPTVYAYIAPNSSPIVADSVALIYIHILLPPLSSSNYTLELNAPVCRVTIVSIGDNFPCPQINLLESAIVYGNYDPASSSYSKATLPFGWLSNLGNDPWLTENTVGGNSIVIAAAVKTGITVGYSLIYSSSSISDSLPIDVSPLSTAITSAYANLIQTNLSTLDGTLSIPRDVSKVVTLQIQLNSSLSNVVVTFSNPNGATNDFVFCSATVAAVGENLPCFNATTFSPTIANNSQYGNCSNTLTFQFSYLCRICLVKNLSADSFTVEVAINVLSQSVSSITVDSTVSADQTLTSSNSMVLTVVESPIAPSLCNISVKEISPNTSLTASVGKKVSMRFNVTIPVNCTTNVQVIATAPSINSRSTMTITKLIIVGAGMNVACFKNTSIAALSSLNLTTLQKNVATLDIGFITNTAMSFRRGWPQPEDDQLCFEVEVLMGDHPEAIPNSTQSLSFSVAEAINNASQNVTLTRLGTELPDISVAAIVLNQKLFRRNDIVDIHLILSHTELSTAEPTTTTIRLFLPVFINITGFPTSNATIELNENYPFISIKLTEPFLLEEIIEVNLTLLVDPNDIRGPDAELVNATTVGLMVATLAPQTIQGSAYPNSSLVLGGLHFFMTFGVIAQGCFDALGMQSGRIDDCQLSASTSVDVNSGPSAARLGGAAGTAWKPALRPSSDFKDYLQINFGNKSRVSQVAFEKDSCCRAPSSVRFESSDTSFNWNYLHQVNSLNYSSGTLALVDLPVPFEGQWLRVIIVESEEVETGATKYEGVRLEFYGCLLETDKPMTSACTDDSHTILSDDANEFRHVSVDSLNNIIYGCDFSQNSLSLNCFCSSDGLTWLAIPISSVTKIVGVDTSNGITYGYRKPNSTVYKSTNCRQWLTTTQTELDGATSKSSFVKSQVLPGRPRGDSSLRLTLGRWTSDYDGLYLDNELKLSWN